MLRSIYAVLVQLHPAAFRRRFGGELLSIFDQSERGAALCGDAAVSLARQWLLRSGFRVSEAPSSQATAALSMFQVLDNDPRLTHGQWIGGALFSFFAFTATSSLIGLGGPGLAVLIGRASAASMSAQTPPGAAGVLEDASIRRIAAMYFHSILVLDALDTNRDLILSSDEIANASRALKQLDLNADGALEAWGCRSKSARSLKMFLDDASFMTTNPVLNALDVNRDSMISAAEIRDSPKTLRSLDLNQDGKLTPEELLPSRMLEALHE